ncbi:MAG TPA: endonuclease/exonuclease/phosphatase family protein [Phycicoccus sp.]|nr:endonuclease/exonuclease/phosphatase family protein [Phycicoccus sp.]
MPSGTTLRVASYNTRDFLDDHHLAARVVRALDPDVLCLQEVPRRLFARWRLARFARRCGLRPTGSHRGSGGTSILVSERVRLESAAHHRLPVRWPDRTRGWALARVRLVGGAEVTVVSLHLSLRAEERERHTEAVLRALADAGPLVVAGDLNEGADGAAWRRLDVPDRLRLVAPDGPTFPAHSPRRRLDVVFASPSLRPLPHREVLLPDRVWAAASDHRPVWVDLEVG